MVKVNPDLLYQPYLVSDGEREMAMVFRDRLLSDKIGFTYSGMKGFSDRVRGVTNSAKNRNYSSIRYFPDQKLIDIMLTGKV